MKQKTKRMAVMGDMGSVIGFRGLGLEVYPVDEQTNSEELLRELIRSENYAVIFMTEQVMQACSDVVSQYRFDVLPALVPIPASSGQIGIGEEAIRVSVRRAVGFDLFANKEEES